MKKLMYVKGLTMKQYRAKERIEELERTMKRCDDLDELFDLFCEADDIWNYNFQMESMMNPDPNFQPLHEKIFLMRQEILEARSKFVTSALVNVNGGTNVTVNITINSKEV